MPLKSADSLAPENVPDLLECQQACSNISLLLASNATIADLALEVIVARKKQSTRHGESDRGDTTNGLADLNTY